MKWQKYLLAVANYNGQIEQKQTNLKNAEKNPPLSENVSYNIFEVITPFAKGLAREKFTISD